MDQTFFPRNALDCEFDDLVVAVVAELLTLAGFDVVRSLLDCESLRVSSRTCDGSDSMLDETISGSSGGSAVNVIGALLAEPNTNGCIGNSNAALKNIANRTRCDIAFGEAPRMILVRRWRMK